MIFGWIPRNNPEESETTRLSKSSRPTIELYLGLDVDVDVDVYVPSPTEIGGAQSGVETLIGDVIIVGASLGTMSRGNKK
jgi:hypothetical protein